MDKTVIAEERAAELELIPEPMFSGLAAVVWDQWQINMQHRQDNVDDDLEQCHLMRAARYSDTKTAYIEQTGGEPVYAPLAAMQSISGAASVSQVVLPASERGWTIKPTPIPELPPESMEQVNLQLNADAQLHPMPEKTGLKDQRVASMLDKLRRDAAGASAKMERKIDDQLVDSGFYTAMTQIIEDFSTYPYAIMQRVTVEEPVIKWVGGKIKRDVQIKDVDQRVSPFDIYWSPGMIDVNDGPLIHRMRLRDYELAKCKKGFREDAVKRVLFDRPVSNWLFAWNDAIRNETEQNDQLDNQASGSLIDVLSYWGMISGEELEKYGVKNVDPYEFYDTNIWLCGTEVLRVSLNPHPLNHRPYYKATWRSIPGQFHGSAPTLQVKHLQDVCNASMRALVKNMGISAGPQVVIMIDQLPKGEESVTSVYPLKVWQAVSKPGQTQAPIQFFQPQSNANELIGVFQHYWELAGDVTGIYRWNYGADQGMQGAAQTMNGLSMLLENSNKVIRHAVSNIEQGIIIRRVYDQFLLNMMYDPDSEIKGDIDVIARGSSSLIERAGIRQRRTELLQAIANIPESQIPGIDAIVTQIKLGILVETAKDLDIEADRFPGEDEIQKILAQYKEMQAKQQQPKDPRVEAAEIAYKSRIEDQKLEMEDRVLQRNHQLKIKEMELSGLQQQMEKAGQKTFDTKKMELTRDVMALKQKGQQFDREIQLKQQGKSGI